ncbi:MAG: PAS domain S-box protein [Chloroflexota bacterium]
MNKPLSLLLIEDSEDDALLVLRELRRGGYDVNYDRVDSPSAMMAALGGKSWDVILSDYSMPSFSAPEALKLLQHLEIDIPFIIVSGTVGEDAAVEAMKAGANDFFAKNKLVRLVPAVERELRDAQERRMRQRTERQLHQSEDRFAKVFQASPVGICISTFPEGQVLDVNVRYCEIFGFEREELLGQKTVELGIWVNAEDRVASRLKLKDKQTVHNAELDFYTKTGDIRHCLVSYEQISLGVQPCLLTMIADITERKQAEQALERNTALIKLLQEVSIAANEASDIDSALLFAVARVCDFTGWDIGHVYLLSRSDQPQLMSSVWHSSAPGQFSRFRSASDTMRLNTGVSGLVARVISSERPEWTDDVRHMLSPSRAELAEMEGINAAYAFPVTTKHEVTAIMEFFSKKGVEPDQALLNTIGHIAAQVGQVIERAQSNKELNALYNATSYLFNADSLHDLAQQIVNGVINEFDQVDCGLLLIDKNQEFLIRSARAGAYRMSPETSLMRDGSGLVPKAIREGRMIYAPDVRLEADYIPSVPATRSELIVPLKTRKSILGVLDLQSTEIDNFNRSDRRVLSAFAERAAAAIEVMQLVEEINRHANELELRVIERTEELHRAKERAEAILNNSSDAIILADASGMIQQTNSRFNLQFGYEVDELFGHELTTILSDETAAEFAHALRDVALNRQYRRFEVFIRRRNGSVIPVDIAIAGFSDDEKTGIVCSLRDISEQKSLEAGLREAVERQKELIELKTRFVSMVSHEYRTPLAAILTSTTLLQDYYHRLTEERKLAHFSTIQIQVQRLTELLEQVLQINKAESIHLEFRRELIDFDSFCRDTIENVRQISPTQQIEYTVIGSPVEVGVDVKLARQIITNLLSNALKYSPKAGTIWLNLAFENHQVILTVRDEGIGIPEDDQNQLFTMYHRARNVGDIQGTGLGLVIIKQAVDAHEGTISVESAVGQGTTFTVTLPI